MLSKFAKNIAPKAHQKNLLARNFASVHGKDILKRLNEGEVILGDGGFVFELEKRCYVTAGPWTPEANIEHPDAVKNLHREFLRAGSDVMQTFTFYASDDKLQNRGNKASEQYTCKGVNEAACKIARSVANEGKDVMVCGGICQTPTYLSNAGKEKTQQMFQEQVEVFKANGVDFMLAEYYEHVEECEWAIEVCLKNGFTTAANMCIGPEGDLHGNSAGDCAVRMADAGAHLVGVNCHFDPFVSLEAMKKMKEGLEATGRYVIGGSEEAKGIANGTIKSDKKVVHLMVQPLAYMTPDAEKQGFIDLPEFPFSLEPRVCTRYDMHRFAREAYELGVRYIGGCCGFESYHIRALSEELKAERGFRSEAAEKWLEPYASGLAMHTKPWVRARANKDYWANLKPASGRPYCPCCSQPSKWGITQGDEELCQQTDSTSQEELSNLAAKRVTKESAAAAAIGKA